MKRLFFRLILISIILISGCTKMNPGQLAKANEEIKEFLKEYPNAELTMLYLESDNIANDPDFTERCPRVKIKDYYKVILKDPDSGLEAITWVDGKKVVCVYKKGLGITTTTTTIKKSEVLTNRIIEYRLTEVQIKELLRNYKTVIEYEYPSYCSECSSFLNSLEYWTLNSDDQIYLQKIEIDGASSSKLIIKSLRGEQILYDSSIDEAREVICELLVSTSPFCLFEEISGKGTLVIKITDKPVSEEITSVLVTISKVEVHKSGYEDESGWITIMNEEKEFDLIQIEDVEEFLTSKIVDVGKYTQIRLYVSNASITIGGKQMELDIMGNSVKLVNEFDIEEGRITELILDFDAEESVIETGNGRYNLKPTIKVIEQTILTTTTL